NNARQHFEIGEALGQMDFEAAARMSGARFVVLTAGLAGLERAIGNFMLDVHTGTVGDTEGNPPLMGGGYAMVGTGQLPKFEEDLFFSGQLASRATMGDLVAKSRISFDFDDPSLSWLTPQLRKWANLPVLDQDERDQDLMDVMFGVPGAQWITKQF